MGLLGKMRSDGELAITHSLRDFGDGTFPGSTWVDSRR